MNSEKSLASIISVLKDSYGPNMRESLELVMPGMRNISIDKVLDNSNGAMDLLYQDVRVIANIPFKSGTLYSFDYKDERHYVVCIAPTGSDITGRTLNSKSGRPTKLPSHSSRGYLYGVRITPLGKYYKQLLDYSNPLFNPLRLYRSAIENTVDVTRQSAVLVDYCNIIKATDKVKIRCYKIKNITRLRRYSHLIAPLV